ncbi:MAG: metallophosphoesterase [Myxococcota bacterium]
MNRPRFMPQPRSVAALAGLFAGALAGCSGADPPAPDRGAAHVSILAVGDTGRRHVFFAPWFEGQLAVAAGMAASDQANPVDALVLLGDNFYDGGLQAYELQERLRENLVGPYCGFVELDASRSAEVAAACRAPVSAGHAIPILAVPGNHDLAGDGGLEAQCTAVDDFVSNWQFACRQPVVLDLEGGLSVIAYDSASPGAADRTDALALAIRRARGPFRVLASHHPPGVSRDDGPTAEGPVFEAVRRAGVPVHAHLAGHNHSLQLLSREGTAIPLGVIAGSGARARPPIDRAHPDRVFGASRLGFARLSVQRAPGPPRLQVSLYSTPDWPLFGGGAPTLEARWSVDAEGRVRDEGTR